MNVYTNLPEEQCTGCGACVTVCPKHCVTLERNADGYWKRRVVQSECIQCGKCLEKCSALCTLNDLNIKESYVAYAKKRKDRKYSASGGFSYVLSQIAVEKGYSVAGAVWDLKGIGVKHIVIKEKGEMLERMRTSKNIQSNTLDVFREVRNTSIIFGTPCQIQAFRNVYGDQKDILLVDMACMGGGGYNLLKKYMEFLQRYNRSGIKEIRMRDKTKSWMTYGTRVFFEDGSEYYQDKYKDPFCQCFNFAHAIQNSCMDNCRWLQKSAADIRIGDAWDYAEMFPYQKARDGLSFISVQSERGTQWIQYMKERMELIPVSGKMPEPTRVRPSEAVLKMLRNDTIFIEDIVKAYHSVSLGTKIVWKAEEILSRNYQIYLLCKKSKRWLKSKY